MQTVANAEQLAFLKRSVEEWNQWRWDHREVEPDLHSAYLSGVNLSRANLRDADLRNATLKSTNLSGAYLSGAILSGAALSYATLNYATLSYATLSRVNLRSANLKDADLRNVDLRNANLRNANLRNADLSGADLSNADLSNADLLRTQALGTNFAGATLTGACIKDWNTNSETNLIGVICDYVYLKGDKQERRPAQGNFAPGDFFRFFQKARETLDLIFRKGIDWRSFADTLQTIRAEQIALEPENPNASIIVRAIETLDDGSFVIRANVPDSLDKAKLETQFQEKYENILAAKEQECRCKLQAKKEQLDRERQHNASLERIIDVLASRPVKIDNNIHSVQGPVSSIANNGAIGNSTSNVQGNPADNAAPSDSQK